MTIVVFISLIAIFVILAIKNDSPSKINTTSSRIYNSPDELPTSLVKTLDAIFVLGGGQPESIDRPPIYVSRRCDDGAQVVQRHSELTGNTHETLPILCLSAGTAHLPQLVSPDGLPIWESTSCATYLKQEHGLDKNVYVETTSYDTIGNAYFARTTHSDVTGWRDILVITNTFHIERSKAIFDWIFVEVDKGKKKRKDRYKMHYLASPNVGLSEEAVAARVEKERKSEKTVREKLAPKYKTLKGVWEFLNESHSFYTASKLADRAKGITDETPSEAVKKSYGGG